MNAQQKKGRKPYFIQLPVALVQQVKVIAVQKGITFQAAVEEALRCHWIDGG